MNRYIVYTLSTVAFLVMVGCGSKKKTLEVTKEERIENKDLSVFQQKDILSSILLNKLDTQITFEPINPAIPIKINDSTVIHNAKVVISTKKTDSTVINRDSSTTKMIDKGEVYEKKKAKNMDLEREDTSNNIKWSIWGIVVILIGITFAYFFIWKKR